MAMDPREFRNALGCFATGVTVITTLDDNRAPIGITANSFTSLSLDPPMVLFCLDRRANSFTAFHANRHFAVNILRAEQLEISHNFARSNPDKWSGVDYETWETGCPIFEDAIAVFECNVASVFEGGDHVILTGNVIRMRYEQGPCEPLLYYRGKYAGVKLD